VQFRRSETSWVSSILGEIVKFIEDDMAHRPEVDSLYNAVQQLMAGYLPHFLLLHVSLSNVVKTYYATFNNVNHI